MDWRTVLVWVRIVLLMAVIIGLIIVLRIWAGDV